MVLGFGFHANRWYRVSMYALCRWRLVTNPNSRTTYTTVLFVLGSRAGPSRIDTTLGLSHDNELRINGTLTSQQPASVDIKKRRSRQQTVQPNALGLCNNHLFNKFGNHNR